MLELENIQPGSGYSSGWSVVEKQINWKLNSNTQLMEMDHKQEN